MGLSTFDVFKQVDSEGLIEVTGEKLCALQGVLLQMLRDVDSVCSRHGIPYTLGGGSCLGAVRHQGFIPWDDDLDINMTREGYRRFAEAYGAELQEKYWLHDCERTPGYDLAFPRLRLKGTTVRTRDDFDNQECGAYIDIFIIDNAPSNALLRNAHGFISMALGFAYSCRRFAACTPPITSHSSRETPRRPPRSKRRSSSVSCCPSVPSRHGRGHGTAGTPTAMTRVPAT